MNYKHLFLAVIVVVALLVIFKPLMYRALDPKPQKSMDEISIPKKSDTRVLLDTSTINKKTPHARDPLAYTTQQASDVAKPELKKVEKVPTEKAYVLQLASFQDKNKAKALVGMLRDKGFRAYQQQSDQVYRVFVGPVLGQDNLQSIKAKVKKETRYKPVSKEYLPLKGGVND